MARTAKSTNTPGLVKVQIVLDTSAPGRSPGLGRRARIRALRENAVRAREDLMGWIKRHRLSRQVVEVSEPNAFNVLYVLGRPGAVAQLNRAPHVVSVSPAGEAVLDLDKTVL